MQTGLVCAALAAAAGVAMGASGGLTSNGVQSFRMIEDPAAFASPGVVVVDGKARHAMITSEVIVRSDANWRELDERVAQFLAESGADGKLRTDLYGIDQRFRVIRVGSVAEAQRVAALARASGLFESARVASYSTEAKVGRNQVGEPLAPINGSVSRGTPFNDPELANLWHLNNTMTPGSDMNAFPVYARGLTGAGVDIAIVSQNLSLGQLDHPDLVANLALGISDPQTDLQGDNPFLTAYAGLIAGTPDNATDVVGIAPGSRVGFLTGLSFRDQFDAYVSGTRNYDIMVHETRLFYPLSAGGPLTIEPWYQDLTEVYATGDGSGVLGAYTNSVRQGRGRRGVLNMYGTGESNRFPGYFRWSFGNQISLPGIGFMDIDTAAMDGPDFADPADMAATGLLGLPTSYYGPRTHYYSMAGRYQSLVIAPITEDNETTFTSTNGTEIIASAYSGAFGAGQGGRPLRVLTEGGLVDDMDSNFIGDAALTATEDFPSLGDGATSIAAGVVALMLEANPSLKIRDVQRILASTARIPTGMNFDTSLPYQFASDWQVNAAGIPHSDVYGFGLIDADAAVAAALSYVSPGPVTILDSGEVVPEDPIVIADATFEEQSDVFYRLEPDPEASERIQFCIRQDVKIEQIEIELTFTGTGVEDLLIFLVSPNGTTSLLHTTDGLFTAGPLVGQAMLNHKFTTYKHWGELSGGIWAIHVTDFGPDVESPTGDDMGDVETFLGAWGVPGDADRRSIKTLVGYRMRLFGENNSNDVFLGCPPQATACPGDLNGDGVVNFVDLAVFLGWYQAQNSLADLNGNGVVEFGDLSAFIALWQPGFCAPSGLPYGRPNPNAVDNGEVVRPI